MHEFNDEIWKVGSYHVGLGDLINYKSGEHSFDEYNCEGISIGASHPDHVANEEYFGKAYYVLKDEFKKISKSLDNAPPPHRRPSVIDNLSILR